MALYGLTHVSFDERGAVTHARVRGIDPTMPAWLGLPVDMGIKGLAAIIAGRNTVVAVFDAAISGPMSQGGQVSVTTDITGRPRLKLSMESPGRTLKDLPRI
jgi:hypothetical protein